jgi:site-specific recombinase XerD
VHVLRHSLGSYLAASGFGLNEIARILGHETLTMAKHYSQIPTKSINEKLDRLWGNDDAATT